MNKLLLAALLLPSLAHADTPEPRKTIYVRAGIARVQPFVISFRLK